MGPYGSGVQKILEESPAVVRKRERLNQSINLLNESKRVVSKIVDRIAVTECFEDELEELVRIMVYFRMTSSCCGL